MNREITSDIERRDDWSRSMVARPIDVTAEDELEFLVAMERYKRVSGRQFPTWSEVFEVLRSLGYAKRIWKPVVTWSPLSPTPNIDETAAPTGWYASAETSMTP